MYIVNAAIKKSKVVDSTQCNIEKIMQEITDIEVIYPDKTTLKKQWDELYEKEVLLPDPNISDKIKFLKEHFFIQKNKTEPDYKIWFDRIETYCKSYTSPVMGSPAKTKKNSPSQTKPFSPAKPFSSTKPVSPTKPFSPAKPFSPTKPDSKTKKNSPSQTKPVSPAKPEKEYNFDNILNDVDNAIHKRKHCSNINLKDFNSYFNVKKITLEDRYKIIIHILLDNIEKNRCIPENENETENPNNTLINEIETNYKSFIDNKLDSVKQKLHVKIVINSEIRKMNEKIKEEREKQEKIREEQKQKEEREKQEKIREKQKQKEEREKQEKIREKQKKEKEKTNCPSLGKEPKPITKNKKEYLTQALIFHPDKNSSCLEQATEKFKKLGEYLDKWKKNKK